MKINQDPLEQAIMTMISHKDFDGYILTRFDLKIVEKIPITEMQTACLLYSNGRFFIRTAEEFFNGLTPPERIAILKHEIAHFINKHFLRRNGRDPYIWNLATDCAINQSIPDLPDGSIKPIEGWTTLEAAEYYYNKYKDQAKKHSQNQGQKQGPGQGQKHGQQGQGKSQSPGQGQSSGLPELFDELMDAPPGEGGAEIDSMTDDIIRDTIKERLAAGDSMENMRGLHAGSLETYIEELTAPPITNWRHVLARFTATLADTKSRITLKRPDRRELTPFGKRKEYLPSLCVCVDTSGSVSNEMLSAFFSQIALLGRRLSEIEVVIADAKVQEHFTYHKGLENKLRKSTAGRGGTDFDPAIRYINQHLRHCDGVVYLTDGWCPAPTTKCASPVIWVVTEAENFEGRPKVFAPIG